MGGRTYCMDSTGLLHLVGEDGQGGRIQLPTKITFNPLLQELNKTTPMELSLMIAELESAMETQEKDSQQNT